MLTTGVLSLGPNRVANTWAEGCKGLGIDVLPPNINKEAPTLDELFAFFATSPDWIYFAGHHLGNELFSERMSVRIGFEKDKITLMTGGLPAAKGRPYEPKKTIIDKDSTQFMLNVSNNLVILWGGCSVCSDYNTRLITDLFSLFGPHVLLGFGGLTGIDMVDVLLGGSAKDKETGKPWSLKKNFFACLKDTKQDAEAVRNAWMQAALAGHGGTTNEGSFRAIDPDGQEWKIAKKEIVRGRKIPVLSP
jgi:hypothetical protein